MGKRQRRGDMPRSAVMLTTLIVALGTGGLVAGTASAHWAGFTDQQFANRYVPNGGYAYTPEIHSYSFASAQNLSDAWGPVCASVNGAYSGRTLFEGCSTGSRFVRTCLDGIYPNCHDADGFSARAFAWNRTGLPGNRNMKVHGVF